MDIPLLFISLAARARFPVLYNVPTFQFAIFKVFLGCTSDPVGSGASFWVWLPSVIVHLLRGTIYSHGVPSVFKWNAPTSGFSHNYVFLRWGYQPQAQPPTWRTSGSFFVWSLPFDLFGMGNPNRSLKAPADVALEVIGTRKPPHHVNVMIRRGGWIYLAI